VSGWRERSAEEREAARLERERRRAQRRGRFGGRQAAAAEPAPDHEPAPAPQPEVAIEPLPALEPTFAFPASDGDKPFEDPDPDDEAPAGTRRVTGVSPRSSASTTKRKLRHGGRRHSRTGRLFSVLAIVLAAAVIWFLFELFQPFHGSGNGTVTVKVPAHSSSSQVGDLLERAGVVSSSFFFELRATLAGERSDLRPGTYHLAHDMSYGDALTILTRAPKPAKVTELTITEGRTRRQIDTLLHSQGVRGSYFAATRHSPLLKPSRYGAPRATNSLEGFLFPSTYELREPLSVGALVADQLRTFRQKFAKVGLGYARRKRLTPYQLLIVASMVEAEAQTARDRPLVASVIYNRLANSMPLQIDATTRYATGNYSKPLTASQLSSSSPYNTRTRKGLPPTPIDNPGLALINAAAHPARTKYLYFVVKPCGNGEQAFTSSYHQFLVYQQQYQAARAKRGGRSPSRC
jgi:peptidoglycan lytic transglycosylase G